MMPPHPVMPQVCWSFSGLCLLGEGAEPRAGRLLGQRAVTATPKAHVAARDHPALLRTCHLPIHPLRTHSLLKGLMAEVCIPSLGFRVNNSTSNPSILQAKLAGGGLMSNRRGKERGPGLPAPLSASSCNSAARLGHSHQPQK